MAPPSSSPTNARPHDETIAGTGPGIPDDALGPGEDALPTPPSDAETNAVAKALGAPPVRGDDSPEPSST